MLKTINFFILLKCFVFFLLKRQVYSYQKPPRNIIDIGFFDKKLKIHIREKYKHYFSFYNNIFTNGQYCPYKTDTIRLVLINDTVLIKKVYKGPIKKRLKFYNEMECIFRMRHIKNIPNILYVDYNNLTIFLQYFDGDCLRDITETDRAYSESSREFVKTRCKVILKKIHESNIALIDVWSHNIIYNPKQRDVFYIDFEDSICGKLIPPRILKTLQKRDEVQLKKEVLDKL